MQNFFGERWDAPAFDDATEIPTPVGERCLDCDELIAEGDSGTMTPAIIKTEDGYGSEIRAQHIECHLRHFLGSPAHIMGQCSCSGGEEPEDSRTWREQGLESIRLLKEREGLFSHPVPTE